MVREPNLKNAVEIIRAEFAAAGIKLPYQKTLDVVAKSKGYSGYEHYLKVQADSAKKEGVTPVAEGADPRPFKTEIVFGSERVSALEHGTQKERAAALDESEWFSFATQAELDAFLAGVEAAEGWLDYTIVDEADRERAVAPDNDGDGDDEDDDEEGQGGSGDVYRELCVRAYLSDRVHSMADVTPSKADGRMPLNFDFVVRRQAEAHAEVTYVQPARFVLHNIDRGVYVVEMRVQMMFHDATDEKAEEALQNLDYIVTLKPQGRLVGSEIIGW